MKKQPIQTEQLIISSHLIQLNFPHSHSQVSTLPPIPLSLLSCWRSRQYISIGLPQRDTITHHQNPPHHLIMPPRYVWSHFRLIINSHYDKLVLLLLIWSTAVFSPRGRGGGGVEKWSILCILSFPSLAAVLPFFITQLWRWFLFNFRHYYK